MELSAVKLAARDYAEALTLLLEGRCWEDAAYVAERVMTADELKTFVDAYCPVTPRPLPTGRESYGGHEAADFRAMLRDLLARRLVRHNRLEEARAYFAGPAAPPIDSFIALLKAGREPGRPATSRGAALFAAARLLYRHGMELRGTELGPDFTIWGGDFTGSDLLQNRLRLPESLRPTGDERLRASGQEAGRGQRFHYRYFAAELAWEAVTLLPDNDPATAEALIEAGGWLKNRDPRAANRFYRALVERCALTPQGRAAAAQHWFPKPPALQPASL